MDRYKVINKVNICGNTVVTIKGPIKPIKIGEFINGGAHQLVSVAMIDGGKKTNIDDVSLVLDGDFSADEVFY